MSSKAAGEIVICGFIFTTFDFCLAVVVIVLSEETSYDVIVILELQECVIRTKVTKVQKQKVQCKARDMLGLVLPLLPLHVTSTRLLENARPRQ